VKKSWSSRLGVMQGASSSFMENTYATETRNKRRQNLRNTQGERASSTSSRMTDASQIQQEASSTLSSTSALRNNRGARGTQTTRGAQNLALPKNRRAKRTSSYISAEVVQNNRSSPGIRLVKHPLAIATWNVTSLLSNSSKMYQLERAFDDYKLDILGVTETHMPESGEKILDNGSLLIYSGTCRKKEHGVGLMISKKLKNSLISFVPFSDRILSARFYSSQVNITIIVGYAPTEVAEKKEKDEFYNNLSLLH
jgi:hypothetical protein